MNNIPPSTEAYFDGWAHRYDATVSRGIGAVYLPIAVAALAAKLESFSSDMKFLDIGSGTGLAAQFFSGFTNTYPFWAGVDVSRKMLEEAKKKAIYEELAHRDAVEDGIPFPCTFFDAAFSAGVVEFFREPEPVIKETSRVIRTGAPVVITALSKLERCQVDPNVLFEKVAEDRRVITIGDRCVELKLNQPIDIRNIFAANNVEIDIIGQIPAFCHRDAEPIRYDLYIGHKL